MKMQEEEEDGKAVDEPLTPEPNLFKPDGGDTDEYEYKNWNHHDIYNWILSLENGRYVKYQHLLKDAMETEKLKGTDLGYVDHERIKQWGVKSFHDKLILYNAIKSIADGEGM